MWDIKGDKVTLSPDTVVGATIKYDPPRKLILDSSDAYGDDLPELSVIEVTEAKVSYHLSDPNNKYMFFPEAVFGRKYEYDKDLFNNITETIAIIKTIEEKLLYPLIDKLRVLKV